MSEMVPMVRNGIEKLWPAEKRAQLVEQGWRPVETAQAADEAATAETVKRGPGRPRKIEQEE